MRLFFPAIQATISRQIRIFSQCQLSPKFHQASITKIMQIPIMAQKHMPEIFFGFLSTFRTFCEKDA